MASAARSIREIYIYSEGNSPVTLCKELPYALEEDSSLVTNRLQNGKLVTFIVRYSYNENDRSAIATLLDRDIRDKDHLLESGTLKPNEVKVQSCLSDKALSVISASVVVIDANKNFLSLVNTVVSVVKSVFNIDTPSVRPL